MARLPNRAYQGSVSGESSSQQKLTLKSQTKHGCNCVNRSACNLYSNTIKNYLTALTTIARNSPTKPWTGFSPWNFCVFFVADTFGSALPKNKCFCQDFAGGSHAFRDCSTISLPSIYNSLSFRSGRLSDQEQRITPVLFFFSKRKPKTKPLKTPPTPPPQKKPQHHPSKKSQ